MMMCFFCALGRGKAQLPEVSLNHAWPPRRCCTCPRDAQDNKAVAFLTMAVAIARASSIVMPVPFPYLSAWLPPTPLQPDLYKNCFREASWDNDGVPFPPSKRIKPVGTRTDGAIVGSPAAALGFAFAAAIAVPPAAALGFAFATPIAVPPAAALGFFSAAAFIALTGDAFPVFGAVGSTTSIRPPFWEQRRHPSFPVSSQL